MSQRSLITCIITMLLLCLAGTFAWAAAPTITTIAPPSAIVGTVITITGTDLDKVTAITFNGIAANAITDNTATALKVTVPEGATSGKLMVTTAGGTVTNSYDFIVLFGLMTNAKDGAEMVWVPGGIFTMGSDANMEDKSEWPAHQVTLSGYWIYQNDITVAQYRAFCTATARKLPAYPDNDYSWKGKTGWDDPALQQHPIVNVSYEDAKAYADWAGVALPTEAQWEYAARGPQGNNYPWGGDTITEPENGWNGTMCAHYKNSSFVGKSTWPVGSFHAGASWCGAYDMAGNVWQLCSDWYGVYSASTVIDPTGPTSGRYRVMRGGSWDYDWVNGYGYRSSFRGKSVRDDYASRIIGFRCVSDTLPTITTLLPSSAIVGTVITITGRKLDKVTAVTFNGIAAKTIIDNTATALKVTIPEGATSGKLVVTTAGGTVKNSYDFIVPFGIKTNAKDNAEMVWIPGATFTMGTSIDPGPGSIPPYTQRVTLSGYWIYKYDVTVAQYRAFCIATKRRLVEPFKSDIYRRKEISGWDDPASQQHPIVLVSWDDAKAYADWAGVTLPTEAQWEYAARGPQGNNYPWGGTATKDDNKNGWDETKLARYASPGEVGKYTWPVGSFPAGISWCGAQDMAGNVMQWCGDLYGDYSSTPVINPTGPANGFFRVVRGSSWFNNYPDYYYRSTHRIYVGPDNFNDSFGFRCASVLPGP